MKSEIKKGDIIRCIRDFSDVKSYNRFIKGRLYECPYDNCITNEFGNIEYWDIKIFDKFFKLVYRGNSNTVLYQPLTLTCGSELTLQDKEENVDKKIYIDTKVNHSPHYNYLKELCGIEVIDITRHVDFDLGNAVKYILRCGHKSEEGYSDKAKTIEDIKKAIWYLNDKLKMLEEEK